MHSIVARPGTRIAHRNHTDALVNRGQRERRTHADNEPTHTHDTMRILHTYVYECVCTYPSAHSIVVDHANYHLSYLPARCNRKRRAHTHARIQNAKGARKLQTIAPRAPLRARLLCHHLPPAHETDAHNGAKNCSASRVHM